MKVQLAPDLIKKLKKINVRIRNNFLNKIEKFQNNPYDPELNNHELSHEYEGYRSIDITNDWRAIYEELDINTEFPIAYFFRLGTHKDLYTKTLKNQ